MHLRPRLARGVLATGSCTLHPGEEHDQRAILRRLVDMHYERNDLNLVRGKFRVRGDTIEVHPAYEEYAVQDRAVRRRDRADLTVRRRSPASCSATSTSWSIFPATHYVAGDERMQRAIAGSRPSCGERLAWFEAQGKLLEAQRLRMRTEYDLEMLAEVGTCSGIENYSRHLDGRQAGRAALHAARLLPRRLAARDRRVATSPCPSCTASTRATAPARRRSSSTASACPRRLDNRPLRFDEFYQRVNQCIFLSATPSPYEIEQSTQVVEQIVRPDRASSTRRSSSSRPRARSTT